MRRLAALVTSLVLLGLMQCGSDKCKNSCPEAEPCGADAGEVTAGDIAGAMADGIACTALCAEQGMICFEGECIDGVCKPGSRFCVDDVTVGICHDDGKDHDEEACPAGFVCEDGYCLGPECGDGEINVAGELCDDGNLQSCDGCEACLPHSTLFFDGGEGHVINVADTEGRPLALVDTSFTVEMWVRLEAEDEFVGVFRRVAGNHGWGTSIQAGKITVAVFSEMDHWPEAQLAGTGWHHVAWAVDLDSAMSRIWLDGQLLDEAPFDGAVHDTETDLLIGAVQFPSGEIEAYATGRMDELRISNAARYTESFDPPRWHSVDEHTLALWHFDEGAGKTGTDASGMGHTAQGKGLIWEPDSCYGGSVAP